MKNIKTSIYYDGVTLVIYRNSTTLAKKGREYRPTQYSLSRLQAIVNKYFKVQLWDGMGVRMFHDEK